MKTITAKMPIMPACTLRTSVVSPSVASTSLVWTVCRGTGRAPAFNWTLSVFASSRARPSMTPFPPLIGPFTLGALTNSSSRKMARG